MAEPALEIPPLENGDCLSGEAFHWRYQAYPPSVKAELIDGVVYMPPPVRIHHHARPHALVMTWLGNYFAATPGVMLSDNGSLMLDAATEVQPDAALWLPKACGGGAEINAEDYLQGAPELVVEVAASSASYDLHQKRRAYCRNGVPEYLVWQVHGRRLDWFFLDDRGEYRNLAADAQGLLRSRIFPGLVLEPEALLAYDLAAVLRIQQRELDCPAHLAFCRTLTEADFV